MFVEIHGAGFSNKGAELMLRTTVDELRARLENLVPAIDPMYGPYELRSRLGLRQIVPPRSHVGTPGFANRFRRQQQFASLKGSEWFRRVFDASIDLYGAADVSRVQGFVDISGFAYTDHWGPQPTLDLAALTKYFRKHKRPVILLPQAFGPFDRPVTREAFSRVHDNAELIFARDRISWEYAVALTGNSEKVLLAPDITLFYPRSLVTALVPSAPYACLVPNVRMLDQGQEKWAASYLNCLSRIGQELIRHDVEVRIVVHDTTGDDLELAKSLLREIASSRVTIIQEEDPFILKEIIGQSLLLVGSRYHSLVAAFANAVPAIGLGWSHKYQTLFQDFACEQLVISPETPIEIVLEEVAKLVDTGTNLAHRQHVAARLNTMSEINQDMWRRVTASLSSIGV